MANPTVLRWNGPTTYTDGSAFGSADLAGFEIQVQGKPAVAVDLEFSSNNQYSFDIKDLGLVPGTYQVTVSTVAKNGRKSNPSPVASFTLVDERVPNPPTSLQAA
jgi:hypothetical protein